MSDALLNLNISIVAFGDRTNNSNPTLRYADWRRKMDGREIASPRSERFVLEAGETKSIFNGTRSTSIDGTTEFKVELSALDSSRYRFTHTDGTNPVLRTKRNLGTFAPEMIVEAYNNGSALFTIDSGTGTFGAVQVGDILYISNTTLGDADDSPFNVMNTGYWQVLAVHDNSNIQCSRLPGETFEGVSETVTVTGESEFRIFSSSGVQIGDSVEISDGFVAPTQRSYSIVAVTDQFFEVMSTTPIPEEEDVLPTASGMAFYSDTKNFVYIEVDQEAVIKANSDSGTTQRVSPVVAGDPEAPGIYLKTGPMWSLTVTNRSTSRLNMTLISGE